MTGNPADTSPADPTADLAERNAERMSGEERRAAMEEAVAPFARDEGYDALADAGYVRTAPGVWERKHDG